MYPLKFLNIKIQIISILLLLAEFSFSQKYPVIGKNIAYAEAWGVGSFRSANVERVIYITKKGRFLASTGVGYYDNFKSTKFRLIPLRLFFCVGKNGFWGEFGINYVFQYATQKSVIGHTLEQKEKLLLFQYGLRYQRFKKRGLFMRAYILPINEYGGYSTDNDSYVFHLVKRFANRPPEKKYLIWGGIGIGYHFGK